MPNGDAGPTAPVVLRHHRALIQYAAFWLDPLVAMQAAERRHGRLVILRDFLPGVPLHATVVLSCDPAVNRTVLGDIATWRTAGLVLPGPRKSALRRIRMGIVSLNWRAHQHYRKLIAGPLRQQAEDRPDGGIASDVRDEIAAWPVGTSVDLWPLARRLVRNVAIRQLFGGDLDRGHAIASVIDEHIALNHAPRVFACPVNLPLMPYRGMLRQAEHVERCILDWAETRRGHPRPDDLLSIVVNARDERGRRVDRKTLAGHVLTLFAASYETCQSVLTWTLFLLAQHPRVAGILLDELRSSHVDISPSGRQVERLPYLDAVIRESMRILPPVPFQVRVAMGPTKLAGVDVPRGTRVILSALVTNRRAETYRDPDLFVPERWASIDPSPFEYLSFSAGPRMCPGMRFGLAVVKAAVAAITMRYRIAVTPGASIGRRVSISMKPSNGIPATLHRQDGAFAAAPITGEILDLVRSIGLPGAAATPSSAANGDG